MSWLAGHPVLCHSHSTWCLFVYANLLPAACVHDVRPKIMTIKNVTMCDSAKLQYCHRAWSVFKILFYRHSVWHNCDEYEQYLCSLGRWVQFLLRDQMVQESGLGPWGRCLSVLPHLLRSQGGSWVKRHVEWGSLKSCPPERNKGSRLLDSTKKKKYYCNSEMLRHRRKRIIEAVVKLPGLFHGPVRTPRCHRPSLLCFPALSSPQGQRDWSHSASVLQHTKITH